LAVLDSEHGAVVIRVVYDGAPMAGKTTSVGALGRGLGAPVYSPAEISGRTLYFDWLDYTGGLFEGHRIRCQIVSAPGQAALASRRRQLLESADVVVFVGDSSPAGFDADHAYLGSLCAVLRQLDGPPVGIVLQANKRDLPDAVPIEHMRSRLDGLGMKVGLVEAIATEGSGIREAFVFAVRLALDRVRELMRLGLLAEGRPSIDSADQLLESMRHREAGSLDMAVEHGLRHTPLSELRQETLASQALEQAMREEALTPEETIKPNSGVATSNSDARHAPDVPNERVASGLVWPPVDGRVILQEVGRAAVKLACSNDGDWSAHVSDRWRVVTPANAKFSSVEEGRPALIELARHCATKCRADSIERCVALAADGHGAFRLWQIARI
jgi:signal recognition particle receptor subunit beta